MESILVAAPELYQGYKESEFFRKLCAVILKIKDIIKMRMNGIDF